MSDHSLSRTKAALRTEALARRDGLGEAFRAAASKELTVQALALPELSQPGPVAGYWPMRSEIDPRPLLEDLHRRGTAVCLPVTTSPTMIFRLWKPGGRLVRDDWGVHVPDEAAPVVAPRILLVPLVAFDRKGYRIGYGKGHYDRTLASLSGLFEITAIGLAFSAQEIDSIPKEDHDRRLDVIVTENESIRVEDL